MKTRRGCRDCGKVTQDEAQARYDVKRAAGKCAAIPSQRNREEASQAQARYREARDRYKSHMEAHKEGTDHE